MFAILATKVRPEISKDSGLVSPPFFRACWAGIAGYFDRRAAMASLCEFDDCALRDIGLIRSQIESAVQGFINPVASSGAISSRADGRRAEATAEAAPWN
jgi:uncharacterized protein YjiS (DUF1127 family)